METTMLTHLLNVTFIALTSSKVSLALLFTLSLATNGFHRNIVSATEVPEPMVQAQAETVQSLLEDGIYLYGQSPEPKQIGQTYMVFEVRQQKVLGAFYMPRSSFDCFHGAFQRDQLALTVVDSYSQESSPYAIALEQREVITASSSSSTPQMGLKGFHPIATLSDGDMKILSTCQANQTPEI